MGKVVSTESRQRKLFHMARDLGGLDGVTVKLIREVDKVIPAKDMLSEPTVSEEGVYIVFDIVTSYKSLPDFRFTWAPGNQYYRVYQYSYKPDSGDQWDRKLYPLVNVGDVFSMADFICFYRFLHKNRPNQRDRRG